MNFIFISPNFPVRYFKWVEAFRDHGVTVLGIGDSPLPDLHPRLKAALTEYVFVKDLGVFPDLLNACRYFERKYGKIDFVESDNEWWLESDARLREALQVTTGFWPGEMEHIKAKSAMKEYFRRGGAKAMRYVVARGPEDLPQALALAAETGWPLFAKPNVGVGASNSHAIHDEAALRAFLQAPLPETYIIEEFVQGTIVSYDGICDSRSEVVFDTSDHFPTPVAEVVNEQIDFGYYTNPFSLPSHDLDGAAFEKVGRSVVKAFGIKQRFFHIEFFLLSEDKPGLAKKGEFVALECNMRPAGGYTPDLIDFACSVSCYEIYADVVTYDKNLQDLTKTQYYAFASARKDAIKYVHTREEILARFKNELCMTGRYPPHLAVAMGDEFFYAKFQNFIEGMAFDAYVRAKAPAL